MVRRSIQLFLLAMMIQLWALRRWKCFLRFRLESLEGETKVITIVIVVVIIRSGSYDRSWFGWLVFVIVIVKWTD